MYTTNGSVGKHQVGSHHLKPLTSKDVVLPEVTYIPVYQSYTPENTLAMRECMLLNMHKQLKRMSRYHLASQTVIDKQLKYVRKSKQEIESLISPELQNYMKRKKKEERLLEDEYLRFDSMIESGNVERVEAYPINRLSMAARFGAKERPG